MASVLDEMIPYGRAEHEKTVRRLLKSSDVVIVVHEPDPPLDDYAEVWRELILEGAADDSDD